MERDDWTYEEGLRNLALFFAVRAPIAGALWIVPVYLGIAPLTNMPNNTILTVLFTVPLGMLAGAPLGRGLLEKTQLYGWMPTLTALGVAAVVVIGGAALVGTTRPFGGDFARAFVPVLGMIGAGAAIFRFTWADA